MERKWDHSAIQLSHSRRNESILSLTQYNYSVPSQIKTIFSAGPGIRKAFSWNQVGDFRNQTQGIINLGAPLAGMPPLAEPLDRGWMTDRGDGWRWFTHSSRGEGNELYPETIGNRWRNTWILSMDTCYS